MQSLPLCLLSQKNKNSADSILKRKISAPARAALFSAILPGSGQVLNNRIWKVPVIYAGLGGFGYLFSNNQKQYKQYTEALRFRYDNDASTIDGFYQYSDQNLITLKNQYRRRRDLSAVGILIVYVLNIIDANVDAHLKQFDQKINENLTLSFQPDLQTISTFNSVNNTPSIKICLSVQSGKNR